jgi:hypothetical protein
MKREFNKYLKSLSEKELVKELQKVYSKFEPVRKYYQLELSDNSEAILSEFKAKIKKEYFPSRGYGRARNSVSRKVITDFKKISVHKKDLVELLLYRAEMMLEFTSNYGDIDQPFYNSLGSSFEEACKLIKKEKLETHYKIYCRELVGKSYNFGWGIYYDLAYSFEQNFEEKA